ncbi:hypothetical protein K8I31_03350 [bacterium]|nr:hypothetical protein [bacterium]
MNPTIKSRQVFIGEFRFAQYHPTQHLIQPNQDILDEKPDASSVAVHSGIRCERGRSRSI